MTRRAAIALAVVATALAALHGGHALARYLTYHNETYDLALYARMAWGVVHAELWDPIVGGHFTGLHMSILMLPLGVLSLLGDAATVLLVVQAAAAAAALWPLARIGARRLGERGVWIACAVWALYPNLAHVSAYEFHPSTVAVLPLSWALDALDRGSARALLGWSAATIACRADLAATIAMLALVASGSRAVTRRTAFGLLGGSLAYLALFVFVLQPHTGPRVSSLQLHFGHFGDSVPAMVGDWLQRPRRLFSHLLEPRRLVYPVQLLAPLLFVPLLAPRWLCVAVVPFALNVLSRFPTTTEMYSHYLTPMLPVLAVAALDGLARLAARWRRAAAPALLAALAVTSIAWGGAPWALAYPADAFQTDARTRQARSIVGRIPAGASVQAPDFILPHLAQRTRVHRAPPPERETEYVVLHAWHRDRYRGQETLLRTTEEPIVRRWLARSDYGVVEAAGALLLMQRGADPRGGAVRAYFRDPSSAPPGTWVRLADCLSVAGASVRRDMLELHLRAHAPCPADLAVRLGSGPRPRRVDLLFDGVLSPAHLQAGDRLVSRHPLDSLPRERLRRQGLHVGALRSSGAPAEPDDPPSVPVPLAWP